MGGYVGVSEKYKHLEIYDAKGAPAPGEVAAIEALLGSPLPRDFLDFLNVANGALLYNCVRVPPDGQIMSFYDIYLAGKSEDGSYGYDTFIRQIESQREQRNIPGKALPFASDGGESDLYLDLTPGGGGRVVGYVLARRSMADKHWDYRYIEIAPSFAEYLEMLFRCEE